MRLSKDERAFARAEKHLSVSGRTRWKGKVVAISAFELEPRVLSTCRHTHNTYEHAIICAKLLIRRKKLNSKQIRD